MAIFQAPELGKNKHKVLGGVVKDMSRKDPGTQPELLLLRMVHGWVNLDYELKAMGMQGTDTSIAVLFHALCKKHKLTSGQDFHPRFIKMVGRFVEVVTGLRMSWFLRSDALSHLSDVEKTIFKIFANVATSQDIVAAFTLFSNSDGRRSKTLQVSNAGDVMNIMYSESITKLPTRCGRR